MDTQKQKIVNDKHDVLQHIPFDDEEYIAYEECKELFFEDFNEFITYDDCTITECVMSTFYHGYSGGMDENGMLKFIALISGMLYMMKNDEVFTDIAYGVNWDINDFETGNYDDLFTPEDLVMIKKDIAVIKAYIGQHPELLLDENEKLAFSKGKFIKPW